MFLRRVLRRGLARVSVGKEVLRRVLRRGLARVSVVRRCLEGRNTYFQ